MKLHNSIEPGAAISHMIPVEVVADLIGSGLPLSIAGREAALDRLPAGNWIGGTTPYFMNDGGGVMADSDSVFVSDLSHMGDIRFASFGEDELVNISEACPEHGFALTILPFGSACHQRFAAEAPAYPQAFLKPTVGWIAGFDLSESGARAYVYDGRTGSKHDNRAVVAHVTLPEEVMVSIDILNIFTPDEGDIIRFADAGNVQRTCLVNGVEKDFAAYIAARGCDDGALPLIGDFAGAHVNASIQSIEASGDVVLYAPVFPGVDYHFATPVSSYADAFRERLKSWGNDDIFWSCNCVLNFVFGKLEGQQLGAPAGPVTFGEIAYQLVNQTLVVLRRM